MSRLLDLGDIQGGILREYGLDYPKGRYILLRLPEGDPDPSRDHAKGRAFVNAVRRWVTTAVRWDSKAVHYPGEVKAKKPPVTFNLSFTFWGLYALGLPTRTLQALPQEFIDGMPRRAHVLGDVDRNDPRNWDEVWRAKPGQVRGHVHVLVIMRAMVRDGRPVPELDRMTDDLFALCRAHGVTPLAGHRGTTEPYQDASLLFDDGKPQPREHFGFLDGISEVTFDEQGTDLRVRGGGKILPSGEWEPIASGEFLLGNPDESQELPPAAFPSALTRNGTFLAYRKLHQNVKLFRDYVGQAGAQYAEVMNATNGGTQAISAQDATELVKAKMIGRWPDGVPLSVAPTPHAHVAFLQKYMAEVAAAQDWKQQADAALDPPSADEREERYQAKMADARRPFTEFRYTDDPEGVKCPLGAHIRRVNTRDMLDTVAHSSTLNNRRRLLRRGLPYGTVGDHADDDSEHGVVFLAYCASLFRQFEFVQQQWLQYGLDFNAGNDRCPILGNRVEGESHKHVIPAAAESGAPPFICSNMPQFVETRGGDYFFVPSLTALRMIAMGTVDPT